MGRVIGKALDSGSARYRQSQLQAISGACSIPAAPSANWASSDMYRLLRWGPMAVADLVAEYFETELLRATIAARGIFGTFLGPWSAGSSLVLLIRAAGDEQAAGTSWFATGGMGAVTQAMAAAAQQAGAEIRSGAEVIEVRVKDGVASGVVLSNGEEITARAVISNADPKRTLLKLVDPAQLVAGFRDEAAALPHARHRRQGKPRALRTAQVHRARRRKSRSRCSAAAFTSAPKSTIWNAPSTNPSTAIFPNSLTSKSPFRRSPIPASRPRAST